MSPGDRSVLFLAGRLGPGGVTTHMSELAQGLLQRGYRVGIASQGAYGSHAHDVDYFESLGVRHFAVSFPLTLSWRDLAGSPRALKSYRAVLAAFQPDVVHVHWRSTSPYAQYSRWRNGIPFVSSLHIAGTSTGWLHRQLSFWGDATIAVSRETEAELTRIFGCRADRVVRVPYGVDTTRFRPPTPQERTAARERLGVVAPSPIVALMGTGFERKGHLVLLKALQQLRLAGVDCQAILAGDPHDAAAVNEAARDLQVAGMARHVGYCDGQQFLWAADIVVLPSLREGLPIVLNEAMHCGLPHIRTPTAGATDQTFDGENGFVIPFSDDAALADRIQRLVTDPALYQQLSQRAREIAQAEFSRDVMVDRIAALYETVQERVAATGRRQPLDTPSRRQKTNA
jgi:glycosyltransferase involved in cell wall biosynthesis